MTKRTRLFVFLAVGILVSGLGTGLIASYMGLQNLVLIGSAGPDELAYVPADARVVGFANLREVMDSELRDKLMQFAAGPTGHAQAFGEGADKFREQSGVDIRTDVDRVVATLAGDNGSQRPLLVARGNFDVARIESLLREKGAAVEEHLGKRLVVHQDFAVAFAEPGLLVIGAPSSVRGSLDAKAAGNDVTDNSDVMRLVKDMDGGNTWAVASFDALAGGARLPAEVARQLPPITWLAASGHVNGGVRGVVRAETRDETSANDLREVIRGFIALARLQTGQRPEFADLMNSFELGGQGTTVSLGFAVPAALIDHLGALRVFRAPSPAPQPEPAPDAAPAPAL